MSIFLKRIFRPQDGTRATVKDQVVKAREKVDIAASRFEETIRELLKEHDSIKGRGNRNAKLHRK